MTLAETAAAGVRLTALCTLRDMLAADLDACESMRDKAALAQRFMDVLDQIAQIERSAPAVKGTVLDELAKRRTDAKHPARPPRAARG